MQGGPLWPACADPSMFVGVADIAIFASLTAAGLAWRREPNIHKRLKLPGTIGALMWPAITRMPVIAARWLSLSIGIAILATFPVRIVIGNSSAWRSLATWIAQ
jgi:hypothetical protein